MTLEQKIAYLENRLKTYNENLENNGKFMTDQVYYEAVAARNELMHILSYLKIP